jgi:hypothetical protein
LELFRAREVPADWWKAGRGITDLVARRTHVGFRPLPPDSPPGVGLPPEYEVEYLYDGGCRWVKQPGDTGWRVPLGRPDGPRQASDPTWSLDALWGAKVAGDLHDDGLRVTLDLREAADVLGHRLDRGPGTFAWLSSRDVRAWQTKMSANVWLGASGCVERIEHPDWPGGRLAARLAVHRIWNGVEQVALGERERLADSQPGSPQDHDQRPNAGALRRFAGAAHDSDDFFNGRWIGRVLTTLVAWRAAGVVARQCGRRPTTAAGIQQDRRRHAAEVPRARLLRMENDIGGHVQGCLFSREAAVVRPRRWASCACRRSSGSRFSPSGAVGIAHTLRS